ncbi:TonB-dependent receptor [Acidobacteria bacterium AB60]|nr:TonB-dependent receptor [Acidobacteria bacterium AB60]
MRWFYSKAMSGVLCLAAITVPRVHAQNPVTLTVEDSSGAAVSDAVVEDPAGRVLGRSGADGRVSVQCTKPCALRVQAPGFTAKTLEAQSDAIVYLDPQGVAEQVTITAYRSPMGELQSPVITRQLDETALQSTAGVTMDAQVRQLPGVELFRRSSSLVANPSSQGLSLRGLGSTSASRTLVTLDDVPLNDPVGGWIHWEEEPSLAVHSVEVVRGGASDLYGSSAIGGVVNVRLTRPTASLAELRSSYGGFGTWQESLLAQGFHGPWGGVVAADDLGTDGYIQEAPWQRGPVDIASNVHAQNGLVLGEFDRRPVRIFARVSSFHENRANGTPYQINGTRLWRYATGGDWQGPHAGTGVLRVYGSTETFHQTFSSISNTPTTANPGCSYRCGETPSRYAVIPDNEWGAAAHWNQPLTAGLLVLAGADVHDVRVWDREQTFGATAALTQTDAHQRDSGLYGELMAVRGPWTLAASARGDWFQNYDARQLQKTATGWSPSATQPPHFDQRVFDPRLGVSRKIGEHWALSASAFRAFRAPTPSELYRSTQVGNQLTKPNGSLLSERATGWEAGVASERLWGTVRASWFDTQVNRPITAVTLNAHSSPILLMRENLGQIESRGISLDFDLLPRHWLAVDGGYQYAHATVTRGSQDLGKWIPEVARNLATLNVRAFRPRLGSLSLQSRLSGRQFDDDANVNMLHGYFRLDAFASHDLGRHLQLFAAGENLLDRTIEVAKTPTTTLGTSQTARAGIMLRVGQTGK